jgi:bifunctional non-homologous end joining protein LigD
MPHPDYDPQLATLVRDAPSGAGWLHEIKYDGYRIGCRIRDGRVTLISRNGKDWTAAFPEVVAAAAALPLAEGLIDGEIAIVLPDGRTSFQLLQNASAGGSTQGTLVYFVFDLLRLNGQRLQTLPLVERKARLRSLVGRRANGRIRYADHVEGDGRSVFDQACRLGLEGIISKRATEPYRPGRHGDWVKTKCTHEQEFVIGGFTDPEGSRAGIGALLIGHYQHGKLVFSGKVGTGFSHKAAVDLRRQLESITRATPPFDPPPERPVAQVAHWVKPNLVCEVEFTEWTGDGKIRHPSFKGLRADKKPQEVKRERAVTTPRAPRKRHRG